MKLGGTLDLTGSSPHTRGARRAVRVVALAVGIIPHTRGAPRSVPRQYGAGGIIPAYAGSTTGRPSRSLGRRDHPAYAGSTLSGSKTTATHGDHPRIRGEHRVRLSASSKPRGSSPHTRGARHPEFRQGQGPGIIPAYAGSTNRLESEWSALWDHPRIRGEHASAYQPTRRRPGSSPHTRGAPAARGRRAVAQGIIPAYAGSTPPILSQSGSCRDHPRIRGEHCRS